MRASQSPPFTTDGRAAAPFGPIWPRLPFPAHGGRFRLPMRDSDNEKLAVRLETLWFRNDVSDHDRGALLLAGYQLAGCNACSGYPLAHGHPVFAAVERFELLYGSLGAVY
jgi:hypothetical protein